MFPDRMDKLILDGVVNPYQYYNDWSVYSSHRSLYPANIL